MVEKRIINEKENKVEILDILCTHQAPHCDMQFIDKYYDNILSSIYMDLLF